MRSLKRAVAITLSAAILTTAVAAPAAWAGDRYHYRSAHRSHDNTGALIGLGILGLATAAIIANANHADAAPAYYPPPTTYYPPQASYYQPQPVYANPCTSYSTVNGSPVCILPDGTWQYVR